VRLRRLRLRNYRSFPSAEIDIQDVTVFVGPNDAGKSSLLDALRTPANRAAFYQVLDGVVSRLADPVSR
jgi:putative ATP-dependent endonuclease of the OLD family